MVDLALMINDPNVAISHKCLVRIIAVYQSLKSAEMKAVDYLLTHPEEFASDSIVVISAKAGCSEATQVRLARKLGFNGYSDLKDSVLRTKSESSVPYQEICSKDSEMDVIRKVFQTSIQAISDTLNIIDITQYEKAVQAIKKAGKVMFIGAGDAASVAMTGCHKFTRMGIDAEFSEDFDIQLVMASHLKKDDVLIAISHSGQTKTVIDVVRLAKSEGATVIGITNYPMATLAKLSTILLTTAVFVQNVIGEIMTKRIPALCIIESLYISLTRKMDGEQALTLEKSNDVLTFNKL
jgi:DNA-binding MurR/RpiR family transcriptional regulator